MNIIGKKVKIVDWPCEFKGKIGTVISKCKTHKNCYNIEIDNMLEIVQDYDFKIIDSNGNYLINSSNDNNICNWCDNILKFKPITLNKIFYIFYCPKCLR